MNRSSRVEQLGKRLKQCKYGVALTGAGHSTESGIPDFRSPDGLYSQISEDVFSIDLFMIKPEIFYAFSKTFLLSILQKNPNQAHVFLADLERRGFLKCIITQNIDGLHQKAGSKRVLQIHGQIQTSHCLGCHKEFDIEYIKDELLEKNQNPVRCNLCSGIVKPDITFFGESLPPDYQKASEEIKKADLLLICGTSLTVYPAALLPRLCSGDIIIINRDPTPMDDEAKIVIHGSLTETFKMLAKAMGLS
ncbi:MAG: NAD-dependent protein deacylase [Spirochaetes bacterium]|nr:NAD-dependent protein deacylase [Spirochaetota bacterium]